jgi:hypothetical protein
VHADPTKAVSAGDASGSSSRSHHTKRVQHTETQELLENCFIDTEGTDQPCPEGSTKDIRATEFLIRTLVVELASRVLFVTRKWGFNAQQKVNNLVKLLNSLDAPNQHVTPSQLLIVIHNHPDVMVKDELNPWIEEVQNSYRDAEIPKDKIFQHSQPWTEMLTIAGTKYFTSITTMHFFLMNNDVDEGKKYNQSIIAQIRANLQQAVPKQVDFIEYIRTNASIHLQKYISGWDTDTCFIDKNLESDFPVLTPEAKNDKEIPDCLKDDEPFSLFQMEITGHSIQSAGYSPLEGRLLINKQKRLMAVQVKCAALTPDKLNARWVKVQPDVGCQSLTIRIKQPAPKPLDGFSEVGSSFKVGIGYYQATLADPLRFINPSSKEELYASMHLEDGLLSLTFALQTNFQDDDDNDEFSSDDDEPVVTSKK